MADTLPPPPPPPSFGALLSLFRRVVPTEFYEPLANRGDGQPTDAFALFRGLARIFEKIAQKGTNSTQARFFLPSAIQKAPSATSASPATGDVGLTRVGPSDRELVIDPGRMALDVRGGRRYVNADRVVWNPGDTLQRVVRFVSEIEGFAGNSEHLANADGRLDLDLVQISDQDQGRAATLGSVLTIGVQSVLQDSGIPDLFDPKDIGLYVRINAAAVPTNIGQQKRIVGFDWPEIEIPVGSGRYPRRVFLSPTERRNTVEALQDDGGVFTDFYSQASTETGFDDVLLLPALPAVGDAFYFGYTIPFDGVEIRFDTPGEGDWEIVWEFWDGVAWQPVVDIDDPTTGFRPTEDTFYEVKWADLPGWTSVLSPAGTGLTLYFVRARLAVFTTISQQPLAGRIVVFARELLAEETSTVTWALRDFQQDSLGLRIDFAQAFSGGRDDDLYVLGDERKAYQQPGESDEVFRDRASRLADVVSPNAIVRVINRILRPFGYEGEAIDVTIDTTPDNTLVGAGFTGLFCDVDAILAPEILAALDLYASGDLFPKDPWLVLQSAQEAYGWFLVLVPYLGEGDFGIFLDEGPLFFDETVQVYYGPFIEGWMDGKPVDGDAAVAAIYNAINIIKLGGVGFTIVRRESLTVPGAC